MKLLALETSSARASACLWEDSRIRAVKEELEAHTSHRLMPLLDGLFKKAAWSPNDLDAIAVDVGPGRFTGLRLGVSAARTLGLALQKPVVEVSSLEALAAQGSGWQVGKTFVWKFPQNLLCVISEAIRDEVYVAVWRFHRMTERGRRGLPSGRSLHTFGHHFKLVHAPSVFPFRRFVSFFQSCFQEQTFLFAGAGALRYRRELLKAFGRRIRFAPDAAGVDPRWVAALGAEKFFRREMKAFSQLQPMYLRPSYVDKSPVLPSFENGNS